jgi:hypothetical protein
MSPVLRDPAPASTQLSPEPEHQNDCPLRVDRVFHPHNAASRPRSQSATGAKLAASCPLQELPPSGTPSLNVSDIGECQRTGSFVVDVREAVIHR